MDWLDKLFKKDKDTNETPVEEIPQSTELLDTLTVAVLDQFSETDLQKVLKIHAQLCAVGRTFSVISLYLIKKAQERALLRDEHRRLEKEANKEEYELHRKLQVPAAFAVPPKVTRRVNKRLPRKRKVTID